MAEGISPVGNFFPTVKATMDSTTYTAQIDACFSALKREGSRFAPMSWPSQYGQSMTWMLGPGHYYDGTSSIEIGAWATGNTASGNAVISNVAANTGIQIGMVCLAFQYATVTTTGTLNSNTSITSVGTTAGMAIGMAIYGTNIPPNTTITNIVGSTLTISQAALASGSVTINVIGFQPLSQLGATVTVVSGTNVTLSSTLTGTVTGAFLAFCYPIGTIILCTKHGTTSLTGIASTMGIFVGMSVAGTGIPGGTTVLAVPTLNSVTLSAAATDSLTSTLTFTPPIQGSNTRLDLVSIDCNSGIITWTLGTAAPSPVPPALPSNDAPIALDSVTASQTNIGTANLSDIRSLSHLGLSAAAGFIPYSGTAPNYITGTLRMSQNVTDTPGYGGDTTTGISFQNSTTGPNSTMFISRDQPLGGSNMIINNNSVGGGIGGGGTTSDVIEMNYQGNFIANISISVSQAFYNITSDYRMKDILKAFNESWEGLANIPIYLGVYKSEPDNPMPMALAHEVQDWAPELVGGEKDDVWGLDGPIYPDNHEKAGELIHAPGSIRPQTLDWSKAGPRLVAGMRALKRANQEIEQLKVQIAELRALITER